MSRHTHHVEPWSMTVTLFISPHGHLGDMRMHDTVRKNKHDVCAASSSITPRTELNLSKIGDEVGLPHMISLPNLMEVTITGKVAVFTGSYRKIIGVIKNKYALRELRTTPSASHPLA